VELVRETAERSKLEEKTLSFCLYKCYPIIKFFCLLTFFM